VKKILFYISFLLTANLLIAQKVKLVNDGNQWNLIVNNEAFYIKGAGGTVHLKEVKEAGGNTIRTWGLEQAESILNEADRLGLKVMLGLWVNHERHGFDYNDTIKVKQQLENFREAVVKFKDHPALLMWGVGNEYELEYSNTKVWSYVNDIAKMIHELDKEHPTATVTAGTTLEKVKFIKEVMTDIYIYGINNYGDIEQVQSILNEGNYKGPYMITEWGPNGHWESPKTSWGKSIEQSSSEKKEVYDSRYKRCIKANRNQCIGSFAFLWGQKQEYTSTWYGLFSESGKPTEAVDALASNWTETKLSNCSPSIDSILVNGKKYTNELKLEQDRVYRFSVYAKDPDGDQLNFKWQFYPESTDLKTGGDRENKPGEISGKLKKSKKQDVYLSTNLDEGAYRLFVFVDDNKKEAYLNIPVYVNYSKNRKTNFTLETQMLTKENE
jgi:hypothetical protein